VIFPCDYQKPVFLDKGVILPVVVYFPLPSMPQLCRLWLSWLDLDRSQRHRTTRGFLRGSLMCHLAVSRTCPVMGYQCILLTWSGIQLMWLLGFLFRVSSLSRTYQGWHVFRHAGLFFASSSKPAFSLESLPRNLYVGLHPGKDFISTDNTPCLDCYATPRGVYPVLATVIGWLSFIPISDRITNGLPFSYQR